MARRLQEEQAGISNGRDALEAERREIAAQRYREPVVAGAILNLGLLIACLLPFVVCLYVLRAATSGSDDPHLLNEVLIGEFLSDEPLLPRHGAVLRINEVRPPDPACH